MPSSAEENQDLREQLKFLTPDTTGPPVEFECVGDEDGTTTIKTTNTKTDRHVLLALELQDEN